MLDRKWYAQVTGNGQSLYFEFDVDHAGFNIDAPSSGSAYYFLKDENNNNDLSDDIPILMTETSSGVLSNTTAINLADGQVFTLATIDAAKPDVTVNKKTGQADPTNTLPVVFTVVFDEKIVPATFTLSDASSSGSTAP
jgi:hypothetical protein